MRLFVGREGLRLLKSKSSNYANARREHDAHKMNLFHIGCHNYLVDMGNEDLIFGHRFVLFQTQRGNLTTRLIFGV